MIERIKTLFINRKYLRKLFIKEIDRLNAERKMAKFIKEKDYLIKHNCVSEKLFIDYQNFCEKVSPNWSKNDNGEYIFKSNELVVDEVFKNNLKEKLKSIRNS